MHHRPRAHSRPRRLALRVALLLASGCADAASPRADDPAAPPSALRNAGPVDVPSCEQADARSDVLLELGHTGAELNELSQSSTRIATRDEDGWALWDRDRHRLIANGPGATRVRLVDDLLAVSRSGALELRSAIDGALLTTMEHVGAPHASLALTPDARHAFALDAEGIYLYPRDGGPPRVFPMVIFDGSRVHVDDELMRVATHASDRIATVSTATGEVTESERAYAGTFQRWFRDGTHFVTFVPGTRRELDAYQIYTADVRLVQSFSPPCCSGAGGPFDYQVQGQGDLVWTYSRSRLVAHGDVDVHRVGASQRLLTFRGDPIATDAASAAFAFQASDTSVITLLDLRADTPSTRDVAAGGRTPFRLTSDADGRVVFARDGVIFDAHRGDGPGMPAQINCGGLRDMVGAGDKLAVATADQTVRIYARTAGAPPRLVGKLQGVDATQIALSADARFLFALSRTLVSLSPPFVALGTKALRSFALDASGQPLGAAPMDVSTAPTMRISADARGPIVARVDCPERRGPEQCRASVFDHGQAVYVGTSAEGLPRLTPSGQGFATSRYDEYVAPHSWTSVTGPMTFPRLLPAMHPLLWLDEDRLLVQRPIQGDDAIIGSQGEVLATVEGRIHGVVARVGADRFHDGAFVYRASDGRRVWSVQAATGLEPHADARAAVAGDQFVLEHGTALHFVTIDAP